jgi:hypothetical protein
MEEAPQLRKVGQVLPQGPTGARQLGEHCPKGPVVAASQTGGVAMGEPQAVMAVQEPGTERRQPEDVPMRDRGSQGIAVPDT